jgi:hypothetical protein
MAAAPLTDRQKRYGITHSLPFILASRDVDLAAAALQRLDAAIGTSRPSIDEQLGRLYLRAMLGDHHAVESPIPEVATVARALSANDAGLWRRAFELSADGLFVIPGRFQLASRDALAACAPILDPRHVDLAVGVAIPHCLVWTGLAHEQLGHRDAARAAYRRFLDHHTAGDDLDGQATLGYARVVFW